MVLWECGGDLRCPNCAPTAPPRHERIHSPDAGKTYADFDQRFKSTDQLLDLLVHKFAVRADGLTSYGDSTFDKSLVLTHRTFSVRWPMRSSAIRSTAASPPRIRPPTRRRSPSKTSTQFNAQAFTAGGQELGFPRLTRYAFRPLIGNHEGPSAAGALPSEPLCRPRDRRVSVRRRRRDPLHDRRQRSGRRQLATLPRRDQDRKGRRIPSVPPSFSTAKSRAKNGEKTSSGQTTRRT